MMMRGLVVTLLAWGALLFIGDATARVLFGPRFARVASAARLPLGLAASTCLLETAGYFLPIRVAAWLLLVPFAYGVALFPRAARVRRPRNDSAQVSSLLSLIVGLVPVFIAGRFTAAALTNNDGTYYISIADRLKDGAWRIVQDPLPFDQCLNERLLHNWNWRLGTPNSMAVVSTFTGWGSPAALAVVTALLFACLPPVAISITRSVLGRTGFARELFVGVAATCSAAPLFVGYQHMTGHLAACSLFPASAAAVFSAVRRGGRRRIVYAALLLCAGIAYFADGASVLAVVAAAAVVASAVKPIQAGTAVAACARGALVGVTALFVSPFTVARALLAARSTFVGVRELTPTGARASEVLFHQRGWLPRSFLDDLSTIAGVDPWPPWPAPSPPTLSAFVTWAATLAAFVLLAFGIRKLRRREQVMVGLIAGAILITLALLEVRYLRGKVLITAAAFMAPVTALGAVSAWRKPGARVLSAVFFAGELLAFGGFVRPSRWTVIDRPADDALVPNLARVPAGSLLAFDGLGAPADPVHDTQRVYRAALLAHLKVVQPGLDGGFYTQLFCPTASRPDPIPARGYAVQRRSSENLTVGRVLARWEKYSLVDVDLEQPSGFIAAWAPTHGFMAAEQEPDGRVFRWGEAEAKGTLQVVARAPCARLSGELRVESGAAAVTIRVDDAAVHVGSLTPAWSTFETLPFAVDRPVSVAFHTAPSGGAPPDEAHALATRSLALTVVSHCGAGPRRDPSVESLGLPKDLDGGAELLLTPPAGAACSEISVEMTGPPGGTLRLSVGGAPPTSHYLASARETFQLGPVPSTAPMKLHLEPLRGAAGRWLLTDLLVTPKACE